MAGSRADLGQSLKRVARKKSAAKEPRPANTLQDKLSRIGIAREQDLVLHLPLRYEDQTHLCPLSALKPGQSSQVEGIVANTEIQYRGRRQLVCLLEDGAERGAQLVLRTTRRAIYAMVERRQMPAVIRIRRRVLFRADDLLHWLDQKRAPSPEE